MHVEDLAARAEPADHVADLAARIVHHLPDRALAEVEPVVGALAHQYEFLEPPRPASNSERGMPMRLRLYLAAGMPAAARFSISRQIDSIWRSRLGPLSRMSGLCERSIG